MTPLSVCHRCPNSASNQPGFAGGPCACLADPQKRDIVVLAKRKECPQGRFAASLNLLTCTGCREAELGPCQRGEACGCPDDGLPIAQHASEGKCGRKKLIPLPVLNVAAQPAPPPRPAGGVGTELKKILATLLAEMGLTEPKGCNCGSHAAEMDARGIEWCAANAPTVIGWLGENAAKMQIADFDEQIGQALVEMAIENARAALASAARE